MPAVAAISIVDCLIRIFGARVGEVNGLEFSPLARCVQKGNPTLLERLLHHRQADPAQLMDIDILNVKLLVFLSFKKQLSCTCNSGRNNEAIVQLKPAKPSVPMCDQTIEV